jgi:hypothetical protein
MATAATKTLSRQEIENTRQSALRAIAPIKPAAPEAPIENLVWTAKRTKAGDDLPAYYLIYFLLVELLRFPNLGRAEKIAWSVPIEFEGKHYLVDYRKFGVGVFCEHPDAQEVEAKKIAILISKGVKAADLFFKSLADDAVRQSQVNVKNTSLLLFGRYEFFRDKFREEIANTDANQAAAMNLRELKPTVTEFMNAAIRLRRQAEWLGTAAIDAFFAWTEHLFIHLAIIQRKVTTGDEVKELIGADWKVKFQRALDIADAETKRFYDSLFSLRRQTRNYMAHGSFGKQGEAFKFHSTAGAVPVMLDDETSGHFTLVGEPAFDEKAAISMIEDFIVHLWSGARAPAWLYIQGGCLPLILTFASDGTYERAMKSPEAMEKFVEDLSRRMDNAANMDW